MNDILVIDDDVASCRTLQLHFRGVGHSVRAAHSVAQGLTMAQDANPDLIILDIRMPGKNGLDGLLEFKDVLPSVPVIMITAFHDMDSTIRAMKRGADDYIHKPLDIDELNAAVAKALKPRTSIGSGVSLNRDNNGDPDGNTMVGRSRAMKEIFKTIGIIAPMPLTVLITGESGTGKELVSRAIHQAGNNPSAPFVAVNCAALVETLLESELFGHEKGAFTGATSRQIGKFAMANEGTILLDEISELSPNVQAKLLRVLQEKEYIPVGGTKIWKTTARVIATTNVDLLERVEQGSFRADLYYRLQVITINVPPLRERKEDIPDLAQSLLVRINLEMSRRVVRLTGDAMDALNAYDWLGNIRELRNVLTKAVVLCTDDTITPDLLPDAIREKGDAWNPIEKPQSRMSLKEMEALHVGRILEATNWHRGRTCDILGISRPRLRRMIQEYGLAPPGHVSGEGNEAQGKEGS